MKIAVCISGLLQHWNITNRLFKYWNSIYDDIDFTFFLSTWEESSTFPSTDKLYEKKGKIIQNNKFSEDTYDFLQDIEFISPNVIPKEITDIHTHTGPFLSYQIYNVQKMRKRYEEKVGKKFDLVVQTREDLMILKRTLNLFKAYYDSKQIVDGMFFSISGTKVVIPRANPKGYSYAIPNDNFFFAHSDAMDKFSEMYNDCYVNKTNKETFNHFMHAQQLIDKGIYNCKLGNRYSTFLIRNYKVENEFTFSSEKLNELLDKKGVEWIYSGDNDNELIPYLKLL